MFFLYFSRFLEPNRGSQFSRSLLSKILFVSSFLNNQQQKTKVTKKEKKIWKKNFKTGNDQISTTSTATERQKERKREEAVNIPTGQSIDIAENHLEITTTINSKASTHVSGHGVCHVAENRQRSGTLLLQMSQNGSNTDGVRSDNHPGAGQLPGRWGKPERSNGGNRHCR